MKDSTIYHGRNTGRELEWTHGEAVPVADRHSVDWAPRQRHYRRTHFRQLNRSGSQHADPTEELALRFGADIICHFGGPDIGRIHEDLRYRKPPLLRVVVADCEAGYFDWLGCVVTVAHGDDAVIQRHRGGKNFEG